jgi:hypothetical protein
MRLAAALLCLALAAPALAQEVTVTANDSTQSVLTAQKGKRVTVRLRSGQEITGTVRDATAKLVVLGAVTGREFFDAVVPLDSVEAVLIRTKQ